MTAVNLGQALALWINTTPPTNTKMLWYDENLTGSGNKIKYYDDVGATWVLLTDSINRAFRQTLSTVSTVITIPDQGTNDYVVEVIRYDVTGGGDGKSIVQISNQTNTSFTVETASGYESGVFIYRILKF